METKGGFLISRIKQLGTRIFDRMLAESGIDSFNGAQGRILYVLWQKDQVPIVEIAEKTGLAKNTLTVMLERMEESGLIFRKQSTGDRRKSLICLTEKARGLERDYNRVSQQMNELFFRDFSPKEVEELEKYLDRIMENLRQAEKESRNGKEGNK